MCGEGQAEEETGREGMGEHKVGEGWPGNNKGMDGEGYEWGELLVI